MKNVPGDKGSAADYLAAERTFLAWIRTGLALMGLGFVVARFGLFLQALQIGPNSPAPRSYGPSFWFGTALIVLGVVVQIVSLRSHLHLVRELQEGSFGYRRPSTLAITIAIALSVIGLAMAIYLIAVREPRPASERQEKSAMSVPQVPGIVTRRSKHSVDESVHKLEATLQAKGVKLFALIDHSGEAEKAGLQMPPTKLLIFGSPKAGTPLMVAAPTTAIDLPLKILVWEDAVGEVWISYNDPAQLQMRHGFPPDLIKNIAAVELFATAAAE